MSEAKRKPMVIDFSDVSGGCNGVEHPTKLFNSQVSDDSIGFTLKKSGLAKQQGAVGLSSGTTFTNFLRGLFLHRQFSGTETLYGVSDGILSSVSKLDGSLTTKYDMGEPLNEAWACDAYGKKMVCNGNSVVKIEGTTAYQVGITAPSGSSASESIGIGLPDGDYGIYVGYARKVDGINVLYSVGESLGTITLSSGMGNNQITITIPNSSDPQVNNKVVWIKSPNELVHYFFYETDDNVTTSITISSASSKETAIIYEYSAADNGCPPAIKFIFYFAGRLWGVLDNVFYYSNDGTYSEYDIEKWPAANFRRTAHKLTGIFSVGLNLYFNTDDGILILPYGDVNQKEILIESRWHFYNMRTVASWNNGVIGVTNQGTRIFDGQQFIPYDISYPIRDKIDKIYKSTDDFRPCGFVYRKDFRDEYHLLWQDTGLSVTVNNVHAVLNLSSNIWIDFNNYNLAWEFQHVSGNYAAVSAVDNTLFIGQSHSYSSKIYSESSSTSQISNAYGSNGQLISSATDKESYLKSRYHIENIAGRMRIDKFYCHSVNEKTFQVRICAGDGSKKKTAWIDIGPSGGPAVVFPIVFPVVFQSTEGKADKEKMPSHFWCKTVYAEVRQTANDTNFKLLNLVLFGEVETNNYL
ncbi:MAG: hypothetical protein JXB48_21185 [Candidatus Latescibacteria bacterium]|nr:hypothetical protein [Candidatus Latescibacterota bacterium]